MSELVVKFLRKHIRILSEILWRKWNLTHKSLYSCPFAVSCVRKVWCKFCELQSLFWRSCNWKSLPNSVSSATQNILKWGQSLFLMVKKIAKFKKAKSLPSFCPLPLPYGSIQTVSAFRRKLCWDTVNYFFVWGTRHQHKLKNTKNISLLCNCVENLHSFWCRYLAWI